jgi:hypothetical protein
MGLATNDGLGEDSPTVKLKCNRISFYQNVQSLVTDINRSTLVFKSASVGSACVMTMV